MYYDYILSLYSEETEEIKMILKIIFLPFLYAYTTWNFIKVIISFIDLNILKIKSLIRLVVFSILLIWVAMITNDISIYTTSLYQNSDFIITKLFILMACICYTCLIFIAIPFKMIWGKTK